MKRQILWIAIVLAVVAVSSSAYAGDHEYVGAAKCKMCHKVQYASWEGTNHAKATETAKASTDREFSADCLTCHATNASEDFAGVQCEACHGAGADFKKMSIMKDLEAAKANGLMIPTQATCDGCHTGDDHAAKKVMADELNNTAAIHEFKNPPGE
jgi:nitrate/TMAO reductase-like tetraheme cytochrome c subunit